MKGRFITLEGPEGSGKSTLARGLAEAVPGCLLTREPGEGSIGPAIRSLLLHGEALDPWTETFLFLADRRQHVLELIVPALEEGRTVICDRFADSTVVYQGCGRGLPLDRLRQLNDEATDGLVPDMTILLDIAAGAGLSRVSDKNRLDKEPLDFHEAIREGFLAEARRDTKRWRILDASQPQAIVLEQALEMLQESFSL